MTPEEIHELVARIDHDQRQALILGDLDLDDVLDELLTRSEQRAIMKAVRQCS
jgi:hypothetical protein